MGKPDARYSGSWKLRGHGDVDLITDKAEAARHEIESLADKAGYIGLTSKDRTRLNELSKQASRITHGPTPEHIITSGLHIDELLNPTLNSEGLGGIRLA
jgi:hypothetical protein